MATIYRFFIVALCLCLWETEAAQTESFDVKTYITARFAETTISSTVKNEEDKSQLIKFQVLLPKEAFISGFSMIIDGKTYDAIVEEKLKAEKAFQAAKQLNKTAGLVSTRKESTKTFKTSVNIEAGETVEFRLVYQQLLRKIRGKYKHQVILLGSQLTDFLTIEVFICEKESIKSIEVPPILSSDGKNLTVKTVISKEKNSAHVKYLQGDNFNVMNALSSSGGSFVVEYELEATPDAGQIVLNNGYFAYFYAPAVTIEPRRVIFVLDISGSMSGNKIEQLKEAMINIVDKLTEEDRFSIVTFADNVFDWKRDTNLYVGSRKNIEDAKTFIKDMRANGGTNIDDALKLSLKMLNIDVGKTKFDPLSNYIVFLTDGQPTSGSTRDPDGILNNVDNSNAKNFSIHAIGFGSGVDANFLKSLAARNSGTWTQILVDINAALQIQNYLDELSVSLLTDIVIDYPPDIVDEFIVHNKDSFLAGGELMALGRFKKNIDPRNRGPHVIEITGNAEGDVVLQAKFNLDDKPPSCRAVPSSVVSDFGMKSFALSDVVETLRKYDAETDDVLKEEIKEAAINKSIEAGLVTPVTSMLVIKPEDKKAIENKVAEEKNKVSLKPKTTPATTTSRPSPTRIAPTTTPWWQVQGDPHFVIHLTDSITTCFNWLGQSGEVFNLLNDPKHGIVINGLVDGPNGKSGKSHAIFITKLVILLQKEHLVITIDARQTVVRDTSNSNKRKRDLKLPMTGMGSYQAVYGHVTFRISDVTDAHTILNVTVAEDISFIVNLHHTSMSQINAVDHLDLMISGSEKLSRDVEGIFGRFPRRETEKAEDVASIETSGAKSYLWYRNEVTPVTKTAMMVPYLHRKVDCWFVAKPSAILGDTLESFKLDSLTSQPRRQLFRR